jgi:hypothetical protein
MNILKSLFLVLGLFSITAITTNAYYAGKATVVSNRFSTGTWGSGNGNNDNNNGNDGSSNNDFIKICHATGQSEKFQSIMIDENGVINGHVGESHQDGQDIIPPFNYGNSTIYFEGQNWNTANIEIYNNDCEALPTTAPLVEPTQE